MNVRFSIIALVLVWPTIGSAQILQLTDENFQEWREHILPQENELNWLQIPWLTTFADGIIAANDADKPVLLWVMNGHPLGCT